ncbi:MAG: exopolysaccharide Pel transporter PelG [SAR324 cluster bacterium]|nr:exopolysaccharide Pel transporter PelG [SAR324 cluster bacterium]
MAGIGFNLKKILDQQTLQSTLAAYFYTGLVTSGPWLFSVIALSIITIWGQTLSSKIIVDQFMVLVIYAFAMSMVLTGGTQMVITRQVSDCLYSHEDSKVLGIFTGTLLLTLYMATIFALAVLWLFELPLQTLFLYFVLFVLACLMWVCMVFVSALKDYMRIVWAFLLGFIISIPATLMAGQQWGLNGFLSGLNLGLCVIVYILIASIVVEFKGSFSPSNLVFQAHWKYWPLYLTGMAASLGIWVDKAVFWYGEGAPVLGPLRVYPLYDGALFVAYLTVLPAMAFFVMIIETDFYESFRRYFFLIDEKAPFGTLEEARSELIRQLKSNSARILAFQIFLTTVILFISPWLILTLNLTWFQWGIFRIACVGAFFHMAFSLIGIVLAYFDCRRELLFLNVFFLVVNFAVTWASLGHFWSYGIGYLVAGWSTALLGLLIVAYRFKRLHYYTFVTPQAGT